MTDDRTAGRQWLLDRLPPELRGAASSHSAPWNPPALGWGSGDRALELEFWSGHTVCWYLFDASGVGPGQTCVPKDGGTFNLALDLTEITDLIRRFVEEQWATD